MAEKNYQSDAQKNKMSLEFLILLFQDKRIEKSISRITIAKQNPKKKAFRALPTSVKTENSAGELKSTAERSHREFLFRSEAASFSSRLSFGLILERIKQQPSNEIAQAAVEKIRSKSYREIADSAELIKRSLDLLLTNICYFF